MKKISLALSTIIYTLISISFIFETSGQTTVWSEDFGADPGGCSSQNQSANGYVSANGAWTVTSTGTNPALGNEFFVSATEAGMGAGNCGDGCLGNPALTNQSLHIANEAGTPASGLFCPTGDCGAAYDASVASNWRAESPVIDLSAYSGMTVSFNYMMFGELNADEASLWYHDGATWNPIIDPLPQATCCGGPCGGLFVQGQWNAYSIAMPAGADNNATVRLGLQWTNDANNSGADPSFAIDDIEITIPGSLPPFASYDVDTTTVCEGGCVNFTDLSTGNGLTYQWTFPGGTPASSTQPNPQVCYATAGTYDVTLLVTDNTAATDDSLITGYINVISCSNPNPVASFTVDQTNICEGSCVNFTDQSTGTNISNWLWTFPGGTPASSTQQNPQVCYAAAGNYDVTLQVTDANGTDDSTITTMITVVTCNQPTASFTVDQTNICEGGCVNFTDQSTGTNISNWTWTFPGGTPATSNQQNPQVCYAAAGTYDVTLSVTDANGTDDSTITSQITVIVCSNPIANFTANNTSICEGGCVDFTDISTGTNVAGWNWTFPGGSPASSTQQNPQICYATAGTYDVTLQVTDDNGVDDTTIVGYITVTVCGPPIANFTVSDNDICAGDCITITDNSVDANSYEWTFNGGNPASSTSANPGTVCFPTDGIFDIQLVVTNGNGTDTLVQTVVVNPLPIISAGPDENINIGESVTLSATGSAGTYSWFPTSWLSCTSCQSTIADPTATTQYTVTVTDANGCTASDDVVVNVTVVEGIGVPNAFSPNGDGENDVLFVLGAGIAKMSLVIYNRYGQKVFETTDQLLGWDGYHDGKPANPGVFVYYLEYTYIGGTPLSLKGNVTLVR
jgi:gliding motility-associated-like protein